MSTLREQIKEADDIKSEIVTVPEWGDVKIEMRTPTVGRRAELTQEYVSDGEIDFERMFPALVVASAYDPETGELLFTIEDIDWLVNKSSAALERLGRVASTLAGLREGDAAVEAGKDVSSSITSDGTPTDSPSD